MATKMAETQTQTTTGTTLEVENTSLSDASLRLSMEQRGTPKTKMVYEWLDDSPMGEITATQAQWSVTGGTVRWSRRWVLSVTDGVAAVRLFNASHRFVAEPVELVKGEDGVLHWDAIEKEETGLRPGEMLDFELNPLKGVSCRSDPKVDYDMDYAHIYALRTGGDTSVHTMQQTETRIAYRQKAGSWGSRSHFKTLGAGRTHRVDLHDNTRLVIETDSSDEITLNFSNVNIQHTLRAANLGADGGLTNVSMGAPHKGFGMSPEYCTLVVKKGQPGVVEQMPC